MLLAIGICLMSGSMVNSYSNYKLIELFKDDPGKCSTIATHWVHNEDSNNYNGPIHIVGGNTWSHTELAGKPMTTCR